MFKKIRNGLLGGLLAVATVFSVGMLTACGEEKENEVKLTQPTTTDIQELKDAIKDLGNKIDELEKVEQQEEQKVEEEKKEEVKAVKLSDVATTDRNINDLVNDFSILNDNHNREFRVSVLVNGDEVANFNKRTTSEVKAELANIEAVVKSGDTIVINYTYNHYELQDGDWQTWFTLGNANILWSTNNENITASQTFVVA